MDAFEAGEIRAALAMTQGDVQAAVQALGIPRKTFYDKLRRHNIDQNAYRVAAKVNTPASPSGI